jgi:hypothetical protein
LFKIYQIKIHKILYIKIFRDGINKRYSEGSIDPVHNEKELENVKWKVDMEETRESLTCKNKILSNNKK